MFLHHIDEHELLIVVKNKNVKSSTVTIVCCEEGNFSHIYGFYAYL